MSFTKTMPKYFDNPIKILHHLKEAGFTQRQAEAQVEIFTDYVEHNLATKSDIKELRTELKELEARLIIKTATIVGSFMGFFYVLENFYK